MSDFNYGQNEIAGFVRAADSGKLVYEPGTAKAAADCYTPAIRMLQEKRGLAMTLAEAGGFGGFPSAQALEAGFRHKAIETALYLDLFIEAMYRMQYGFLRAGKLMEEADAMSANLIRQAGRISEDRHVLNGGKA